MLVCLRCGVVVKPGIVLRDHLHDFHTPILIDEVIHTCIASADPDDESLVHNLGRDLLRAEIVFTRLNPGDLEAGQSRFIKRCSKQLIYRITLNCLVGRELIEWLCIRLGVVVYYLRAHLLIVTFVLIFFALRLLLKLVN